MPGSRPSAYPSIFRDSVVITCLSLPSRYCRSPPAPVMTFLSASSPVSSSA